SFFLVHLCSTTILSLALSGQPRPIAGVLCANPTSPRRSTVTIPAVCLPLRLLTCAMALLAAAIAPLLFISLQASQESALRIISSPIPVAHAAPAASSAYIPAPITAESPTLPGFFSQIPPVETAADGTPERSTATSPPGS